MVDYYNKTGDEMWLNLSLVGVYGNLTDKHPGDTIIFTTEIIEISDSEGDYGDVPACTLIGVMAIEEISEHTNNHLVCSLIYRTDLSDTVHGTVQFTVSLTIPDSAPFGNVHIALTDPYGNSAGTMLNSSGQGTVYLNGYKFNVEIIDLDGNGQLSDGDCLYIRPDGSSLSGYSVTLSLTGYSGSAEGHIP